MSSVAIFVDAGYLFAQGSAALTGAKKPRESLRLNETAVLAELTAVAHAKSNNIPLLRVYWYDGARAARGMTLEHSTLAFTDYIKLRLGFMNSQGQQKGVDSLIVTDIIELARNQAISDAVLLSGDEDVRIGVRISQSFGVRVHLLGIAPCRGSQSPQLMQEADTTTEWDAGTVGKFLSVAAPAMTAGAPNQFTQPSNYRSQNENTPEETHAILFDPTVQELFDSLDSTELAALNTFWGAQRGLPQEIDGKLLARCRVSLNRNLDTDERRYVRNKFTALAKAK